MMLKTFAATCLLAALALSASAAAEEEKVDASAGFLAHYGELEKAGRPRKPFFVYLPETSKGRAVKVVYVKNTIVAPAGATFEDVPPLMLAQVLKQVDGRLRAGLSERARLSQDAMGADVQVLSAVTVVAAQEKGKGVIDLVPVRLVTGTLRNAVQGKELEAIIKIESRVLDATTGAVLRERVDQVAGDEIGRAGDPDLHITQDAVNKAIDAWVKAIVKATVPKLK